MPLPRRTYIIFYITLHSQTPHHMTLPRLILRPSKNTTNQNITWQHFTHHNLHVPRRERTILTTVMALPYTALHCGDHNTTHHASVSWLDLANDMLVLQSHNSSVIPVVSATARTRLIARKDDMYRSHTLSNARNTTQHSIVCG